MRGQNALHTGRAKPQVLRRPRCRGRGHRQRRLHIEGNELKLTAPADFETKDSYSIRILGKDASGLSIEKTMVLTVLNDLSEDGDNDGLIDGEEQLFGSDPTKADTDNDGFTDGEEFTAQTDPTDAQEIPEGRGRSPKKVS